MTPTPPPPVADFSQINDIFGRMADKMNRLAAINADLLAVARATIAAHDAIFGQCASNPIVNAWGKEVDVSALNEANWLAEKAVAQATQEGTST